MLRIIFFTFVVFTSPLVFAQTETIDNCKVIDMTKAGLSAEVIVRKIESSQAKFDTSSTGLIELKKAGVDDSIIGAIIDRNEISSPSPDLSKASFSENGPSKPATVANIVTSAKTIAFGKSSVQPSRQALEKELLNREDFRQLNLTIQRYKETADLLVDIGFVSGSLITHRYVYRIYDRKTGAIITAGETTSWGSLAENLARHIAKRLAAAKAGT